MRFAHPHILWLILVLPVLGLLAWSRMRNAGRQLERALSPAMADRLTRHLAPRRRTGGLLILLVALLLLLLGAARPQRGTQYVTAARRGVEVIVALDLSESMLAEDLKPNRLRRARHEISGIIDRLQGDRVGLVAFAGAAFVQCPLTLDYSAARMFLRYMGPGLIPEPGTNIADALRVATKAFPGEEEGFRALILITDGEDHEGSIEEAAREAKKAGVRIFAVGIGSDTGEPIPLRDEAGEIEGYKKDSSGKVVLTRLNEEPLRAVAEATGGLYVRASETLGLDRILDEINRMEKKELEGGVRVLYEDRYSYFVWPALLFLIAQWALPLRRRRLAAGLVWAALCLAGTAGAQGMPPGAMGGGPPAVAEEDSLSEEAWAALLEENQVRRARDPEDPRPLYNMGNLYYLKEDLTPAEEHFQIARGRSDPELAADAAYNLGNTLYKANRFPEARDAYVQALGYNPDHEDAKINLELTQRLLDQLSQQPDSSCQGDSTGEGQQDQEQPNQDQGNQQGQEDQTQQEQEQPNQTPPDEREEEESGQQQDQPEQGAEEEPQDQADAQPQPEPSPSDSTTTEQLQLMQILKGLEASEKELLEERFQARSRNVQVEKDW